MTGTNDNNGNSTSGSGAAGPTSPFNHPAPEGARSDRPANTAATTGAHFLLRYRLAT